MENEKKMNELEALNVLVQIANKFQGSRGDFQLIEKSIELLCKMEPIASQIKAIEEKSEEAAAS